MRAKLYVIAFVYGALLALLLISPLPRWASVMAAAVVTIFYLAHLGGLASLISDVAAAAERQAAGDAGALELRTGDEIEKLSAALNAMGAQAEESKALNADWLRKLGDALEECGDAICLSHPEIATACVNKRFTEVFAFEPERLGCEKTIPALFADPLIARDALAALGRTGEWKGTAQLKTRSGGGSIFDVRVAAVDATTRGEKAWIQVFSDRYARAALESALVQSETDRRQIEAELRSSEARYHNLLDAANDAILIFEPGDGRIVVANKKACEVYGYEPGELVGVTMSQLTKNAALTQQRIRETLEHRRRESFEAVHVRKDGTPINLLATASVLEYGGHDTILTIIRDMTAKKRAEEALEKSLAQFEALMSKASAGNLAVRANESDESLGRIIQPVNKMLEGFAAMLRQVKELGISVSSSATQILAASEEIARGAEQQMDEITNTSSAVEEMAASMTQVSRNAEATAATARRTLEMAGMGAASVHATSQAMTKINEAVQQTAGKMTALERRSREISEIIGLITEIAAQTNLLSLNAAIEAAHAGDAGAGFGVVAEEIRKLADRSNRAARDIAALISAIQTETEEAISAMDAGAKEVEEGNLLARQAQQAYSDISEAVGQSSALIEEISLASDEQARVTSALARAMQTISAIAIESSGGAHETARTVSGLVQLSDLLNEAIARFKISEESPSKLGGAGAGGAR
ncbi:MAG TPA: methyl-accepting chemotaxis protein [Blastocatellia bacterium]|nr:methyl-accepting chemotaxis protein [Blastocatellia bacterium]